MAEVIKVKRSDNYPKNFFDALLFLYKLGGVYRAPKDASKALQFFYKALSVIMMVYLHIIFSPAEIVMLRYTYTDLNLVVEHFGMIVTHMIGIVKFYTLFYNYKTLIKIMDTLNLEEFKYEDCGDYKPGDALAHCKKWSTGLVIFFLFIGSMVPLSKQSGALLWFITKGDLIDAGNYTCQEALPYFNWFPFYIDTTRRCQFAFLMQSIPMLWYVYSIISGDCTFASFCLALSGHFDNLNGAFRTVTERCKARLGLPEDFDVLHVTEYPPLHREIRLEFKRMTIHLQTLIKICATFEDIYNVLTLGQTMTSMFIIVSCLYMITEEEFMSPVFVAEADYIIAGMAQLFLYCSFGNEITEASGAVSNGIYESQWYAFADEEKRSQRINMLRLQVPIQFTTGKFAVLTLSTFVSIVKGSYSYFTVLKQSK